MARVRHQTELAQGASTEYDFRRTALPVFHDPGPEPAATFPAFREGYESVRDLPPGVDRRR